MTWEIYLKTAFGNWSPKRVMSFICLVTAITLAFLKMDNSIVLAFLGASFGKSALTLREKTLP